MLPCLGLYKGNLRPSNLASHVLSKFFFQRMEFVSTRNQYVANWHSDGTVLKRRWWYLQHGWMKITSLSKKDINSFGAGTLVELKWCVGSLCPTSDSQFIFKEIVISLTWGSRGGQRQQGGWWHEEEEPPQRNVLYWVLRIYWYARFSFEYKIEFIVKGLTTLEA